MLCVEGISVGKYHSLIPQGAPGDGSSDLSCHRVKTKDLITRLWPFLTSVTVSMRDPITLQSTCPARHRLVCRALPLGVHLGRYPTKTCLPRSQV